MQEFIPSIPVLIRSGSSPNTISNPNIKKEYEHWLEKQNIFLTRNRSQTLFRKVLNERRIDYENYLTYLKNHLGDTTDSIVAQINAISDTMLKSKLIDAYL